MVRINRVYTRTGDTGTTRLVGGQEVQKTHPRIAAYGTVDELNATLGLARVALEASPGPGAARLSGFLIEMQQRLFDLGSELACLPEDLVPAMPTVGQATVDALEAEMDALNADLPELTSFVLPGGGAAGAALHLARTVCRRAERLVLELHATEPVRDEAIRFLNRLSDYLFVASRAAAKAAGVPETLWVPGRSSPTGGDTPA
jgi:cob(I)alamin adenosyltransferase